MYVSVTQILRNFQEIVNIILHFELQLVVMWGKLFSVDITDMLILFLAMLLLQTSVKVCTTQGKDGKLCLGSVGRHRVESALLTVYTRNGTVEARHVEHRCSSCETGYWHGYFTQVVRGGSQRSVSKNPHFSRDLTCTSMMTALKKIFSY